MIRLLHTFVCALVMLFAAGCGRPEAPRASSDVTDAPAESRAPVGEQLLAQPPQGWTQISNTSTSVLRAAQFIPDGEDESSWTRMIKFESMSEDPLPDPIEFIDFITAGQDRQCGTFESYPTFAGFENGYQTSVSLLICHQDRETKGSEITMMKTIRGNDHFYVITRAKRGPPVSEDSVPIEEEVVAAWSLYMKSIGLCDTEREAHPCPAS